MTSQVYLNQFFGPFFRSSENDKWHWKTECTCFPTLDNPQTKITNTYPDNTELCDECRKLDKNINQVSNHKL